MENDGDEAYYLAIAGGMDTNMMTAARDFGKSFLCQERVTAQIGLLSSVHARLTKAYLYDCSRSNKRLIWRRLRKGSVGTTLQSVAHT